MISRGNITEEARITATAKYRFHAGVSRLRFAKLSVEDEQRDEIRLKKTKELSFGEKKILDTVQNLLVKEISIVKNQKEEDTRKEMNSLLS